MRRLAALIIAPLLVAACSSGDDAAPVSAPPLSAAAQPSTTASAAATTPDGSAAPTTEPGPTLYDTERCEDEPDLTDYTDPPIVVRPCDAPTELVIQTVVEGEGDAAAEGDTVFVDYVGVRVANGEMFDNSFQRGAPFDVSLGTGGVIEGWDQGLIGAKAGEIRRLDIPADLAYGDAPPGPPIESGDDLTFVVVVRAVVPATTADDAPLNLGVVPSEGASDLIIDMVEEGNGVDLAADDTAIVNFLFVRGDDRTVLLNTWATAPVQVQLQEGGSLPGIVEALTGATVGDLLVVTMPPEQAFGPAGQPDLGLPAETDLIAVIEVAASF